MVYPKNIEEKLGFVEIRRLLRDRCLSALGEGRIDEMTFLTDVSAIRTELQRVAEFTRLEQDEAGDLPIDGFVDVRMAVSRLRLEGTCLEEQELFALRRSLHTTSSMCDLFLKKMSENEEGGYEYPSLAILAADVPVFPSIVKAIDRILDEKGEVRDDASPELRRIRGDLRNAESSVSRTLTAILRSAQTEGLVERDTNPTLRDGRLVIPVAPGMKRKIRGIVHDESASGKTVFIEPAEVVEANNRIRELEGEERREIHNILLAFSNSIRAYVGDILSSYTFLAEVDFIRAKAHLGKDMKAVPPQMTDVPLIDWTEAVHPLLRNALERQGKKAVPLDLKIDSNKRILIISGPNAGGKSVCLKTAGLLQYMLQCGLPVPMNANSRAGVFNDIMVDIGDEQSIDDDLSTYSSHLLNMKNMLRHSNERTLILIDEFGGGTEPQIGGAIAEAVLRQLCRRGVFGVITTHYHNLKHFATVEESVENGAMLYDRRLMQPLFKLQIGQPGSSFAIDIARKIGLPESVISDASEIVGNDYIKSDRYLTDILRDKRYWENKRQTVHQREKQLQETIEKYERNVADIESKRKEIIANAKRQAEELLSESNRKIENAVKEIKERQAERKATLRIRKDIDEFKESVADAELALTDELIEKKMAQIKRRKELHEQRRREKTVKASLPQEDSDKKQAQTISVGDAVKIKGTSSSGVVAEISGNRATVFFGELKTVVAVEKLVRVDKVSTDAPRRAMVSASTRDAIDRRKENFHQDLDIRGMRGDEALSAVTYFVDDAVLLGMDKVRIIHGKGDGILRQLIRDYLHTVKAVSGFADEDVRFGGAGITVVHMV